MTSFPDAIFLCLVSESTKRNHPNSAAVVGKFIDLSSLHDSLPDEPVFTSASQQVAYPPGKFALNAFDQLGAHKAHIHARANPACACDVIAL